MQNSNNWLFVPYLSPQSFEFGDREQDAYGAACRAAGLSLFM